MRSKHGAFEEFLASVFIPCSFNATLTIGIRFSVFTLQAQRDWKAVIRVETEDLNQMPIVDFAPGEFLTSNEFGFEVGPICFS